MTGETKGTVQDDTTAHALSGGAYGAVIYGEGESVHLFLREAIEKRCQRLH